jgi:hypothetical protein
MIRYEKERKMLTSVIPQYEGVQFVEFLEIPLKDIIRPENGGRVSDFDINKVRLFEKAILTGQYFVERYEPPMVSINEKGQYVLETGNHRFMGHVGAGKDTMLVAVIEFEDERAQIKLQNLENAEENEVYIKNYRSSDDIIGTAAKLLNWYEQNEGLEITEKLIKKVIKELLADKHEDYTYIFEELKKDAGIRGSVTSYTDKEAEAKATELHGDSNSASIIQLFRTVQKSGSKADERVFMNVLKKKLELGVDYPITVYGHFTRLGAEKVVQGRTNRPTIFEENKEYFVKLLETLTSPEFTNPTFKYLPQLDGVEVNVD